MNRNQGQGSGQCAGRADSPHGASGAPASPARLRILVITPWYPSWENPAAGVFVREHAKAARLYDDVSVIHTAGAREDLKPTWHLEEEADHALTEGIPTYRLHHRGRPAAAKYLLRPWSLLRTIVYLRRRGFAPHVLHAHVYEAGVQAVIAGSLLGLPVIVSEHSSAFHRDLLRPSDLRRARFAFRHARMVLPVSHALQADIERHGIRACFRIIPNALDTELFFPPPTRAPRLPFKLLFVGGLDSEQHKGLPRLLRALSQPNLTRLGWTLGVAGDGLGRPACEELARALNLTDRVVFRGTVSKAEVARLMREADLFILPSTYETAGCVVIEALASGLPIVASRVGGLPEMLDTESAELVPPGDTQRLAAAIERMLDRLDAIDGRVLAQKALRFGLTAVGAQLHDVYLRACGTRSGS